MSSGWKHSPVAARLAAEALRDSLWIVFGEPGLTSSALTKLQISCDDLSDRTSKPRRFPGLAWQWIALVALFLGTSGCVRYWRDWKAQNLVKESQTAPFALSEIPSVLGPWHVVEGSESTLDPEIARVAGSSDHIIRTYVNEKNGERAVVMVIYGLAYLVWPHTPDACFPAAGFKSVPTARDVDIQTPQSGSTARFRVQRFAKYRGGQEDDQEVHHSFFNAGRWDYDMEKNWKSFRDHPGMFKVQVQRQAPAGGKTAEGSMDQLLGCIVQEIESRSDAVRKHRAEKRDRHVALGHLNRRSG
jgi:hypothetical protein